ncbi:SKP1-like protein 4 [Durio zibethinus]|uniref:SKP1-like protein 4 n=1 Tax=Durio zibethinus TaxID=66656 RepID=A0A6P6A4S5_DURZI|nr:SKP1-like protein 4 [Durio zibethinus]
MKSRILKIKTSDNEISEVEEAVATMSKTIKIMAEGYSGGVIPLNNVHSTIFGRVIEWCKKHVDDGEDLEYYKGALKNWDAMFFEVDQAVLYHLLTAANYLDILSLCSIKDVKELFVYCNFLSFFLWFCVYFPILNYFQII